MAKSIKRWWYRTILKKDNVCFKTDGNCTVIIKSYFPLTPMQFARIQEFINNIGCSYSNPEEQMKLLFSISLYLVKKKAFSSSKSSVNVQYIQESLQGHNKLIIDIKDLTA